MRNVLVSTYVKLVGIVGGVISLLSLVSKYPVQVGLVVVSAGIYFVGEYLRKNGS